MSERYKLVYFNSRGRAELIRYIFAYADIKYEDFRFEFNAWHNIIPYTPFKNVPVLLVNDDFDKKIEITGQLPICRFLAHRFNICGGDEECESTADMIVHQIVDLFEKFAVIEEYETSEDKRREQFNVFVDQSLPQYLQLLENFVAQRGSSLLVNNKVTWADLAFAAFFNQLEAKKDFVLFPYPHLKEIDSQVNSLPQIVQLKQLSKQNTRFNY